MRTKFNKLLMLLVFSLFIVTLISIGNINSLDAHADFSENEILKKCEEFTNSDLLYESDKNIRDFAKELNKLTEPQTLINDIEKVIPAECITPHGNQEPFYYIGKEYGFFIEPSLYLSFNIFLFDLTWSNDSNEQKARIDVLSKACVSYYNEENKEVWRKVGDYENKNYYLKNIIFDTLLLNENDLNYKDKGYRKSSDSGLMIQQTRLNYDGVKVVQGDGTSELKEFVMNQMIGAIPYISDIYSTITLGADIANIIESYQDSTETIECNNENNIFTCESRNVQLADSRYPTFSRVSHVYPSDNVLIGQDGYAECITLLDSTNQKSRILQIISFDIVSVDQSGKQTIYNCSEGDSTYYIVNEKILFEEQSIINAQFEDVGTAIPVYILPQGRQIIKIKPQFDGIYSFNLTDYSNSRRLHQTSKIRKSVLLHR